MQPRHRVSRAGIELIKRFEGYRRQAALLPDGRWTLGHGHTLSARKGAQVSPDDAEALLRYDLIAIAHAVNATVYAPLTQNQFDALASFAFNLGLENFSGSSVLKRLNEGSPIQAASAMELWRKAEVAGERIVIDALVRRRSAERALFLTPEGGAWTPAPSPILRPLLDTDAREIVPRQTPADVITSMTGEAVEVRRSPGPATIAAEAVTARLSTLFQDPNPEPLSKPSPFEDEVPFFLRTPEPEGPPEIDPDPVDADEPAGDPQGADLFDLAPGLDAVDAAADGGILSVIDDMAPQPFAPPRVRPLPESPQGGAFILVVLAALGLAFFGGGVFWATQARPMPQTAWLDPQVVGWIAGVTGALFFAAAAFFLLERLGQASERAARNRP
ncbi:glycoside hydrolase family protein [Phenylobacterium sp.]|uniref:glycoside hydrolase family protein n=1 Tax=Phenylobacterium sp. TaxID=1871053 RepID=UPI00286BC8F8|nr:glycoside hydrolase family protein [Phenylobacterium sp.]